MSEHETMSRHRSEDNGAAITINRSIPLPWLVSAILGIAIQAITVWLGLQAQGEAIKDLTVQVKELRAAAAQGGLKTVEIDFAVKDLSRRVQLLEAKVH